MMRSLYAGVAGLKTHQTKMDVLGNNIANVNTTSYKSQSITFSDLMYQTTQTASAATQTRGGVNARQIGLGAKSGAIATAIEGQGASQTTNNPFDIMIAGKSFFVVDNGTGTNMYTRDGSFFIDGAGNLAMQANGYLVQGWVAYTDKDTGEILVDQSKDLERLQIMNSDNYTYAPAATDAALISGNIDDNDRNINSDEGKTMTLEFYDNKGYLYTAKFKIENVYQDGSDDPVPHQFKLSLDDIIDSKGNSIRNDTVTIPEQVGFDMGYDEGKDDFGKELILKFNAKTGDIDGIYDTDGNLINGTDEDGNKVQGGTYKALLRFNQDTEGLQPFGHQKLPSYDEKLTGQIEIDFSTVTNYNTNGTATIKAVKGDKKSLNTGRAVGEMNGINISTDGQIYATYTNGQTKLLGQIATAQFANASGLSKEGDNLYSTTLNSGVATIQDITADGGYMNTGVLEMSNVDLSKEFTEMITTQRGFQANSRIITVSDTLLEELTNLKR